MAEKFPTHNSKESPKNNKSRRRDFLIKTSKALASLTSIGRTLLTIDHFADLGKKLKKEKQQEKLRQKSFYEDHAKEYPGLYGDRLYTNSELLDKKFSPTVPDKSYFKLTPKVRILQYFLRNGREQTFSDAEKLGCKHHQTVLDNSQPITNLYKDAGIDLEGETINWLEVPDGRSGGILKDGQRYGGKTEIIMSVEAYKKELDDWIMLPAQKAGYKVDVQSGFQSTVANEMTHEIQFRYFPSLFSKDDDKRLDEPFKSFKTEVTGLKFRNTAQAAEFLSDVSSWVTSGKNGVYYRFFNPIDYMDKNYKHYNNTDRKAENDRYWYSYQIQRYAMEEVLKQKGFKNAKAIVEDLIQEAKNSDYKNHDHIFVSARKYFDENDFEKIAQIYRRIGVKLLKSIKPYFSKEK